MLDVSKMTIGEIAKVEELSGQSINMMAEPEAPQAKLMAAIAYVFRRRQEPDFKFKDAMNMTMEEIGELLNV